MGRGGLYQVSPAHHTIYLHMVHQGPRHQVFIALRAVEPLAESLPVSETLYHYPEAIGILRVSPYRATGLARHSHRLAHIIAQSNLVKQLHQYVKRLMYLGCLC